MNELNNLLEYLGTKISRVKYRERKNRRYDRIVKSRRRSKNYDSFRMNSRQKAKIKKKKFQMPDKKWKYKIKREIIKIENSFGQRKRVKSTILVSGSA